MKILITGGNNAKAMKLLKAFPNHFVLFADYGDVPSIVSENYAFSSLGAVNKDSVAHILLNFCITESIDSIIPLYGFEVEPIAKSTVLFEEYGIHVLLPNADEIADYLSTEKTTFKNFAVLVNGECIFASGGEIFVKRENELSGIFGYNEAEDDFKLFII